MILDLNLAKCTIDNGIHLMFEEEIPTDLLLNDGIKLDSSVSVELDYKCTFEYVIVKGQGSVYLTGNCFRCGDSIKKLHKFSFDEKFLPANKISSDDIDSYAYSGDTIDTMKMIVDNLLTSLPSQFLCKEDCKGICPQCFANLNTQECACKPLTNNAFACLNDINYD